MTRVAASILACALTFASAASLRAQESASRGVAPTKPAKKLATPAPQAWREPKTFMGIVLGVPLSAQPVVGACPVLETSSMYGVVSRELDKAYSLMCFVPPGLPQYGYWGQYSVVNGPALGTPYSLNLDVDAGTDMVRSVKLRVLEDKFSELATTLRERYGRATQEHVQWYTNGFGAQSRGRVMVWSGKEISLRLEEVGRDSNSVLTVWSPSLEAADEEAARKRATEAASRL